MSYMKEVATIIEEAAARGVSLDLDDFANVGGVLMIDDMPADEWVSLMCECGPDTLADMDV